MANYNVTITDEGAALLATVIATQGTITFTEARLSDTNYDGAAQTLTENTFAGTFLTTTVSASKNSATELKASAIFHSSGVTEPHDMYSLGIIGTDGNTTALVCVLTTTNPDNVEPTDSLSSTYTFNAFIGVSSTDNITVTGTAAGIVYDTDSIDVLADVDAPSPSNSDLLIYNGSTSKWTAQANPFTKPNLLKNGWFTVNERGFSSLVGFTTQETVNGWTFNSNASGVNAAVTYTSGILTLSDSAYVEQRVGSDKATALTGKTLTMSAKLSDGTIYSGTVTNFDPTSDATFYNDTEPTLAYKASLNAFRIVVHASETVAFRAIKLELGSISTLANDVEPNKNVEIIKCQNPLRVVGTPNVYRGQEITLNADFWARLDDGSFENQQVGDTITINGRKYTLAHANYWLHTGDVECTANHWLVISPNMGNAKMNSDNSTAGGYLGSGFRSGTNHDSTSNTALTDALATIKSDFGASHILSHREFLDNAITGGYPSSGAWVDSEAELISEIMAYGNRFFDPSTNLGATIPALYSIDKSQLALYAQRPDLLTDSSHWWLRDVVTALTFARVNADGSARFGYAADSFGVRLAFGIKA